ncbi:MAG TPA: hypothetical protein PKC47_02060 [Petrimonas sp.]|nr:hypothetical protein [Petrimonas sp.]
MKHLLLKLYTLFYTLRLRWRGNLHHFKRAVRKANRAKKRNYVYFIGGKYRVFTRKDIQRLKMKGVFKHGVNTHTLSKICLYDTLDGVLRHPNPKYNKFLNR